MVQIRMSFLPSTSFYPDTIMATSYLQLYDKRNKDSHHIKKTLADSPLGLFAIMSSMSLQTSLNLEA